MADFGSRVKCCTLTTPRVTGGYQSSPESEPNLGDELPKTGLLPIVSQGGWRAATDRYNQP